VAGKGSNREEFSKAYLEYFPLVFNAVYTKVSDKDIAGDISQEVFVLLYQKFGEIENIRKWLHGTLRYVVMQYYEKNSREVVDIDSVFQDVSLTFVNGFRESRIIINEAIDNIAISEEERLIFDYIAVSKYSQNNVGRIMGLSRRQVGYRYWSIVKRILDYLKQKGIDNIGDLL